MLKPFPPGLPARAAARVALIATLCAMLGAAVGAALAGAWAFTLPSLGNGRAIPHPAPGPEPIIRRRLIAPLPPHPTPLPWRPRPVFAMSFEESPRRAQLETGSIAVIEGDWKLIHYMGKLRYPMMPPLHNELYDLAADPSERHDLAAADPGEVRHLLALIDAQLALHGGPLP